MSSINPVTAYLDGELESHSCSICYELMLPPEHTPMLLFPCGHTLCQQCLTHHISTSNKLKQTCALCRTPITSSAPNISLQQIIQSMQAKTQAIKVAEKKKSERRQQLLQNNNQESLDELVNLESEDDSQTDVSKYIQNYHQYSLRCNVLQSKLMEIEAENIESEKEIQASSLVLNHLQSEEQSIVDRFKQLQLELDLVRETMAAQRVKQEEIKEKQRKSDEIKGNIEKILGPLERDRDKAEFIVKKLAPNIQLAPARSVGNKRNNDTGMDKKRSQENKEEYNSSTSNPLSSSSSSSSSSSFTPYVTSSTAASSSSSSSSSSSNKTQNTTPFSTSNVPWPIPSYPPKQPRH